MTPLAPILFVLVSQTGLAAPPFFRRDAGTDLAAMVSPGVNVISQILLDLTGSPEPERVVLLGRPGADGVVVAEGLAALTSGKAIRVLGSLALPTNAAYSLTLGSRPIDLDGDGRVEVPVHAIAGDAQVGRFEDTLYISLRTGGLAVIYTLAALAERAGVRTTRTVTVTAPGHLREEVRVRSSARESASATELVFEPESGRFTPLGVLPAL